jgi:hypothetical protein
MYAYVHHVKQSGTGHEGLNSFLYETRPPSGTPIHQQVEIDPPANNSVESYLEIDFPKGTTRAQVEALLVTLSMVASQKAHGTTPIEQEGVGRAEFMILPKYAATRQQEFDRLKRHLLALPLA